MRKCAQENCFVPETPCDLGHPDPAACDASTEPAPAPADGPADDMLLPWSGSALGLADLAFVTGRARPSVVAVVGPENAGKTTLLGAWYLLLGRGSVPFEERWFAGSYTLAGWEAVAGSLRWKPGRPPRFPAHTSSRGGRAPGLLHLSLVDARMRRSDYLFADAPGEWFRKWAFNRDSPEAEGARWATHHADVLLLVADRAALSGEHKGRARNDFQMLARRVAAERRDRPVALVWTKSDVELTAQAEQTIRAAVFDLLPDAAEFAVSVFPEGGPEHIVNLLEWTLAGRRAGITLPPVAIHNDDPLFRYRARTA